MILPVDFDKKHLIGFNPKYDEFTQYVCIYDFIMQCWEGKYTVFHGDKIIAILMYNQSFSCVYDVSMIVSQEANRKDIVQLPKFLENFRDVKGAIRLQTEAFADEYNRRWHRFCGFELEGTRRKVFLGRDVDIWGRIWE